MKRIFIKNLTLTFFFMVSWIGVVLAWGVWGHQHINRAAVFALPAAMSGFFYNHIDFITEESVVPDLRKYSINDKAEFPRHFINLESYDSLGVIAHLPLTMKEVRERYADTFLTKAGILPWYIEEIEEKLTKAFKAGRKTEILFLAADLGHYIGDAHMPLHTALNHDGLLTGQRGIHAFWEGQLPEMFGAAYNLYTGPARYIGDIGVETRAMIDSTYGLAEEVLALDRELSSSMPKERVYLMDPDSAGKIVLNQYKDPVHSREYALKYHARLRGMIERQLRAAIAETASYWYTAWVNAGKPDLSLLDPRELTERNKAFLSRDQRLWKEGRVDMVNPGGEFTTWMGRLKH